MLDHGPNLSPRSRPPAGPHGCSRCGAALLAADGAPATAGARASTLVIEGAGDGHGVGMSQDGALGYAQHGFTYQAILAHYYTGTTLGQAPAKAIVRVLVGSKVLHACRSNATCAAWSPPRCPRAGRWPRCEAQAVASRTYALTAHAGGSRFDVYSDTRSQVYRGVAAETAADQRGGRAPPAGQIVPTTASRRSPTSSRARAA